MFPKMQPWMMDNGTNLQIMHWNLRKICFNKENLGLKLKGLPTVFFHCFFLLILMEHTFLNGI